MNSSPNDENKQAGGGPSDKELRAALANVVSSEDFASAPRLQDFLTYVVEEALAGRGAAIKGKAIAVDVYDRQLRGDSGQNLVRVEARRLRRRLRQYYSGTGAQDPWQIVIDVGGYNPRFERSSDGIRTADKPHSAPLGSAHFQKPWFAVAIVVIAILAIYAGFLSRGDNPEPETSVSEAERAAYRDRSVQALQAVNLAEQARGMLFPIFDVKRQEIALEMFQHAIELDPGLPFGYAGAAQTLTNLALMDPAGATNSNHLADAGRLAQKALDVAPTDPWAQGANAWVLAMSGNVEDALLLARRSVELAPEDGHVLDLAGCVAIMVNEPRFAADVSDPNRSRSGVGRFAANNIWGLSQLMLGNYEDVIDAFSAAPESGAPVSAPSIIFMAVAYDHVGDTERASRMVAELNASWPEFPATTIVDAIFQNAPEVGDDILDRLAKHGYP